MYCPKCGKEIPEDSEFCVHCGARLDENNLAQTAEPVRPEPFVEPQPITRQTSVPAPEAAIPAFAQTPLEAGPSAPVEARKKRSRKPLFLTLGAVALVAILAVGAWLLFFRKNQKDAPAKLQENAMTRSLDSLASYVESLPNLQQIVENTKWLTQSDTLHLNLHVVADDNNVELTLDYDRTGKLLLRANVKTEGVNFPLNVYMDKTEMQFRSTPLFGEDKVLSLPMQGFGKAWNESVFPDLIGGQAGGGKLYLPDDFSLTFPSEEELEKLMERAYGEDGRLLIESYQFREVTEGALTDMGKTCERTLDKALLDKLAEEAEEELKSFTDLEGPEDLRNVDLERVLVSLYLQLLSENNVNLVQRYCVNGDDVLTGCYMEMGGLSGEIRLDGAENPWQHVTYSMTGNNHFLLSPYGTVNTFPVEDYGSDSSDGDVYDLEDVYYIGGEGIEAGVDLDSLDLSVLEEPGLYGVDAEGNLKKIGIDDPALEDFNDTFDWYVIGEDGKLVKLDADAAFGGYHTSWDPDAYDDYDEFDPDAEKQISLELTSEIQDDSLILTVNGGEADDDFTGKLIYRDSDGRITAEDNDGKALPGSVRLTPEDGGFSLSGTFGDSGSVTFIVSSKVGEIAPLSASPVKLFSMSREELEETFSGILSRIF